ncbi:MAG: type IV toxin-antitoxin system AbiEi family antitoxin domain-containing protein [Solirubrobacteraceae bacterium]
MRAANGHSVDFRASHRDLAALATRQNGVFSLAQLEAIGLARATVYKRAKRGRLHRIHSKVYALVPPELLTRHGRYMAAVLACGSGAALSHRSAADLLELRATERSGIEVTIPGTGSRRLDGIDIHRSTTLDARLDATIIDGITCTTVARTLLDLCGVVPRRATERAFDQAEVSGRLDLHALQSQLDRNRGRPQAAIMRAVVEQHRAGSTVTWSMFEESLLAVCRDANVPAPEVNVWVSPPDGDPPLQVDFLWRDARLIVETDGHASHGTRAAFERDRRRDQRLIAAGWRVVRITWRQLTEDPERAVRLIVGLLAEV